MRRNKVLADGWGTDKPPMTRSGLLLIGGEGPNLDQLACFLPSVNFIIAADSGLDLADKLGLKPDLVVGDMDSIVNRDLLDAQPREHTHIYPENKDETDTEIGLRFFHKRSYKHVILAGGGEGRLDHLLGILQLFERSYHPQIWLTAREHSEIIEESAVFDAYPGQIYSFFPMGGQASGLSSTGLKWGLDGLEWKRGQASISNVAVSSSVSVSVKRGKLLMCREYPEKPGE